MVDVIKLVDLGGSFMQRSDKMENLELVSKLYTKVFNVMAELGWIEKEGQVSMGNTKYEIGRAHV